ncbi:MAG: pilus assembly PilX family protein [Gammaproteobacteria bacterium]
MMRKQYEQFFGQRRFQKGAVLVASLMFMTTMSLLGINGAKQNVVQSRMADNYRTGIEALNNAESALSDALATINAGDLEEDGFTNELDPDGDGNLDDRFSLQFTDEDTQTYYNLVMVDDDDGDGDPTVDSNDTVLLIAQGTTASGTVRTIQSAVGDPVSGPFDVDKAILTEESLEVTGNPTHYGTLQDIHSNSDVDISGSVQTDGLVSASGTVTGTPDGDGATLSGAPSVAIPHIDPADFEQYADYIFESDGKVYDSDGFFVGDADGVDWNGWKFNGDRWTTVAEQPLGGDLYFKGEHGNADIAGNPGKKIDPWIVTILAEGYIEITGTPFIENYMDSDDPLGFQSILFMAGTDLFINGNYDQVPTFQGVLAAGEQIDVKGNVDIHGSLIAGGQGDSGNLVTNNTVSGNAKITFDGLYTPWEDNRSGVVTRLFWLQRTLAEGAGDFTVVVEEG